MSEMDSRYTVQDQYGLQGYFRKYSDALRFANSREDKSLTSIFDRMARYRSVDTWEWNGEEFVPSHRKEQK